MFTHSHHTAEVGIGLPIVREQRCVFVTGVPGMGRTTAMRVALPLLRGSEASWTRIDSDILFPPSARAGFSELTGRQLDTPPFKAVSAHARDGRFAQLGELLADQHNLFVTETVDNICDPDYGVAAMRKKFPWVQFDAVYMVLDAGTAEASLDALRARLASRAAKDPEGYGKMDQKKLDNPDYYAAILRDNERKLAAFPHRRLSFTPYESEIETGCKLAGIVLSLPYTVRSMADFYSSPFDTSMNMDDR